MPKRVAVGDPRQVTVDFGTAADGPVSVSIDDARAGVTLGPFTATQVAGGEYGYMLTAPQVAEVNELTLAFTATVAGVERNLHEVVQVAGAHYFTVAEARNVAGILSSYTDAEVEAARMAVEDQIEANCDTSFVARYGSQGVNGSYGPFIRLNEAYIQKLISVIEDDIDVTSECTLDGRFVWRSSTATQPWSAGHRNIMVRYEGGYDTSPPEDLRRKAMEATKATLNRESGQGMPTNVLTMGTEVGTLRLAVAGLRQPFGFPEVDAVVALWAQRVDAGL